MTTTAVSRPRAEPFARVTEFGSAVATIMVKELRSRMRGRRAFVVLSVYLALLAAITYAMYQATYTSVNALASFGGGSAVNASATIGQTIFTTLSMLQLLLISFIAPAFTAGAISLEREKQTLDLLITTPLRPGAIVVGKLVAALAYVFLLILASIPLSAIVLMYGGAGIDDLARQIIVLFAAAIAFGSIGIFFSALVKRTQAATVLTYSTMLALTLGTAFVYIIWGVMTTTPQNAFGVVAPQRPPEAILYLNPFVGMADVVANTEQTGMGGFSGMIAGIRGIDPFMGDPNFGGGGNVVCQGDMCFEQPMPCPPGVPCGPMGGGIAAPVPAQDEQIAGHFWPRFALSIGVLSLVLTRLSMRLVSPAAQRVGRRRRRAPDVAA